MSGSAFNQPGQQPGIEDLGSRLPGRVLTMQYDLAVQRNDEQQAALTLARLIGMGLRRIFK